jgi:hypothetical protein
MGFNSKDKGKERILSYDGGSSRSHCVVSSLWKMLGPCLEIDCQIYEPMFCRISEVNKAGKCMGYTERHEASRWTLGVARSVKRLRAATYNGLVAETSYSKLRPGIKNRKYVNVTYLNCTSVHAISSYLYLSMSLNYPPLPETKEAAPVVHIKILYIKTQSLPSLQMYQYSSPLETTAPTGSWGSPNNSAPENVDILLDKLPIFSTCQNKLETE